MNPAPVIRRGRSLAWALIPLAFCPALWAGPYSGPLGDPANAHDAPVPGFTGPDGIGKANWTYYDAFTDTEQVENPRNVVNPLFFGWLGEILPENYQPAQDANLSAVWKDPDLALGPVTAVYEDVVSLGDLSAAQVQGGAPPGSLVGRLARAVKNLPGADFVVFENSFPLSGATGRVPADLAFIEVSSDGMHFARMPARSLTTQTVNQYGTIVASDVYNLAGKHGNNAENDGNSWGTPFDLADLAGHAMVTGGQLNLDTVRYIRVVDIPGTGQFLDATGAPIYDPSVTIGSGGFDLEAIGAISVPVSFADWQNMRFGAWGVQGGTWQMTAAPLAGTAAASADPDGDGLDNLLECALGTDPLHEDRQAGPRMEIVAGQPVFSFTRDSRITNLRIDVESSTDLSSWQLVARSDRGAGFVPEAPYSPAIGDASASAIQSIGVIRRHTVGNVLPAPTGGARFFRLNVSQLP